ncbi:hypothetical protein DUI87_21091 [Hirundo rustica rustica]|uniref:Uncharacterized protein n=1 Tax=Hirundo rustica rustica TaxID=333673 RepID=A0A3M0JT38_HIRRU|nr:hypothetical protein DUI87_21091 [Hirundo rustica rustica]
MPPVTHAWHLTPPPNFASLQNPSLALERLPSSSGLCRVFRKGSRDHPEQFHTITRFYPFGWMNPEGKGSNSTFYAHSGLCFLLTRHHDLSTEHFEARANRRSSTVSLGDDISKRESKTYENSMHLRLTQNPEWKKFWLSLEPFLLLQADLDPLLEVSGHRLDLMIPKFLSSLVHAVIHPVILFVH